MPHQLALNIIATMRRDRVDALKAKLGRIKRHVDDWDVIPLARLGNVHFARLIVFDAALDFEHNELPPKLALLTNYDAPEDQHIRALAHVCGEGLDEVFEWCVGYPDRSTITVQQREAFLRAHSAKSRVDYINRQGRSVAQILQEDSLRRSIDEHLNETDYTDVTARELGSA